MRHTSFPRLVALAALVPLLGCERESAPLPTAPRSGPTTQAFAADRTPWSEPVNLGAPVNSPTANEQGPALSPDGLALYFCSNRPPSLGNDLWVSRRATEGDPWGDPVNLGPGINSTAGDCGPAFSQDGLLLFFNSQRSPGAGLNDLYMASRTDPSDDLSWSVPVRLGPEISTTAYEASPFVTRWYDDGTAELYFDRGASNASGNDIYVVTIDAQGVAMGPATAVAEVNSSASDVMPTVRFDGREMLLSSSRGGGYDLFVATRQSRNHPWSEPVPVDELNVSGHAIHPELSRDGRTVFFVRGTGQANDIWMATRTPSGS